MGSQIVGVGGIHGVADRVPCMKMYERSPGQKSGRNSTFSFFSEKISKNRFQGLNLPLD